MKQTHGGPRLNRAIPVLSSNQRNHKRFAGVIGVTKHLKRCRRFVQTPEIMPHTRRISRKGRQKFHRHGISHHPPIIGSMESLMSHQPAKQRKKIRTRCHWCFGSYQPTVSRLCSFADRDGSFNGNMMGNFLLWLPWQTRFNRALDNFDSMNWIACAAT